MNVNLKPLPTMRLRTKVVPAVRMLLALPTYGFDSPSPCPYHTNAVIKLTPFRAAEKTANRIDFRVTISVGNGKLRYWLRLSLWPSRNNAIQMNC